MSSRPQIYANLLYLHSMEAAMKNELKLVSSVTGETIERLNEGDMDAFNDIYRAYYVYLCSIAMYYIHNRHNAASIVDDVFVSFWDKRKNITYPPLPYLRKSVQNACVSHLRADRNSMIYNSVEDEAWNYLENHILSSDDPLKAMEDSDAGRILEEKINELPLACREVFRACLYEGKSYDEIAAERGLSVSTVRVHVKNAMDRLRNVLDAPILVLLIMTLMK